MRARSACGARARPSVAWEGLPVFIGLRDLFAAMAMQGLLAFNGYPVDGDGNTPETDSMCAYRMADAMLAEREKAK